MMYPPPPHKTRSYLPVAEAFALMIAILAFYRLKAASPLAHAGQFGSSTVRPQHRVPISTVHSTVHSTAGVRVLLLVSAALAGV